MFGGFYTAASGMLMQQRSLNTIANNMANAKTPGFRTERVISSTFEQELLVRQEGGRNIPIGKGAAVRVVQDVPTAFDPGMLEETGRPFDLAISGEGYFNVATQEGQTYLTRNGNFDIDEEGYLILSGAGRVQGRKGDVRLEGSSFTVDQDGVVYDDSGRARDTLLITAPREGTTLTKFANGLFQVDQNPPATPGQLQALANGTGLPEEEAVEPGVDPVASPNVLQGVLEGSNVNYSQEVALLMETQRNFQTCSKALQIIDAINQKAANIAAQ